MPKIIIKRGDVADFNGDVIIIPCDTELTNRKVNSTVEKILENGGNDLLSELSSIGYCEIGNAIITKRYKLKTKHLVFLPYCDSDNEERKIDFILLHKALRSAFNLASLYKVTTIAISLFRFKIIKQNFLERILNFKIFQSLQESKENNGLNEDEVENIVIGVASEFKDTTIREIYIYK